MFKMAEYGPSLPLSCSRHTVLLVDHKALSLVRKIRVRTYWICPRLSRSLGLNNRGKVIYVTFNVRSHVSELLGAERLIKLFLTPLEVSHLLTERVCQEPLQCRRISVHRPDE